jgi:hypothetical protein
MGAPVVALARLSLSCAAAVLLCVCAPWQRALPCMAFLCPPALALPPAPAAAPRRSTPNPVSERPLVQRWPRTGRKTLPARTPQTSDTALTAVGEDTTEGHQQQLHDPCVRGSAAAKTQTWMERPVGHSLPHPSRTTGSHATWHSQAPRGHSHRTRKQGPTRWWGCVRNQRISPLLPSPLSLPIRSPACLYQFPEPSSLTSACSLT